MKDNTTTNGNVLIIALIAVAVGLIIGLGGGYVYRGQNAGTANSSSQLGIGGSAAVSPGVSQKELELRVGMRKLWEDHISWTRNWIVSFANNNGDTDAVTTKLLSNQDDIGNAIKPYYGVDSGNKLTGLLKDHINLAVELVKAAKNNNTDALNSANTRWYDNANQIADFLASANPNWSSEKLRNMMKDHLDLTKKEATDILSKNYEAGISDYDNVQTEILNMSDVLAGGIVKQFPDKF